MEREDQDTLLEGISKSYVPMLYAKHSVNIHDLHGGISCSGYSGCGDLLQSISLMVASVLFVMVDFMITLGVVGEKS